MPVRLRILIVLLLLLVLASPLVYRAANNAAPQRVRLVLADNVVLTPPPALPESDIRQVTMKLKRLADLKRTSDQSPSDTRLLREYGHEALQCGDPISALSALQAVVHRSPQPTVDLLGELGIAQNLLGRSESALATCREMIHAYPHESRAYIEQVKTLDLLHQRSEAMRSLEAGISAVPITDIEGRALLINEFDILGDSARPLIEAESLRTAA